MNEHIESTALAQPFCVNHTVGDLPHFVIVRQCPHWQGPTELLNNVSKNVNSKKSDSYRLFELSDTKTCDDEKNDVIFEKLVHVHFHFLGKYSKLKKG